MNISIKCSHLFTDCGRKMLHTTLLSLTIHFLRKRKDLKNIFRYLHDSSYYMNSKKSKLIDTTKTKQVRLKVANKKSSKLIGKERLTIMNYLRNNNPDIADLCPKQIIKLHTKDTNVLYLIDEQNAVKFVSLIKDDLLKNTSFVAELNPGLGLLTKELLKADIPCIHLYEARKEFQLILQTLLDTNPGKLDLYNFNLFKISQLLYIDKITNDSKRLQEILQNVKTRNWEDETSIQVIGATSAENFFKHLIYSFLFRNSLMSHGRPVFYIAIPPSLYHKFTCNNNKYHKYTSKKVIFQLIFNYEILGILNRNAYLPWPRKSHKLSKNDTNSDYEEMYVIKLEPKADLYSQFSQEDWIKFWYFLRHNMRKRNNRVIPELEKWVAGCGVRLIAKNLTIYTQFGELTPQECMDVFKEFKSWPEYKTCNLHTSLQNSLDMFDEPALLELNNYEMQE